MIEMIIQYVNDKLFEQLFVSDKTNCGDIDGELLIDLTRAELGDDEVDEVEFKLLLFERSEEEEDADEEEDEEEDEELESNEFVIVFVSVDCKSFKVGFNLKLFLAAATAAN